MDYNETVEYLFGQLPVFQSQGAGAYKPGLGTAHLLDDAFGHRHREYKIVHVAGTNGKGSTSHAIASVLMAQGYKVGLYTSPHLVDFRERIRVNGEKISEEAVVDFVQRYLDKHLDCQPSFFELTTIMAFEHFADQQVDYAVIEVGLGGRLDTTNIVSPVLSVITNVQFDHTALLGNTLAEIAAEKGGIIKAGVPVVVGEAEGDVRRVLAEKAMEQRTSIVFSEDTQVDFDGEKYSLKRGLPCVAPCDLTGEYQQRNINNVLHAMAFLPVGDAAAIEGLAHVQQHTGLMARWMCISEEPETVCDTGHNPAAWTYISRRLAAIISEGRQLRAVLGFAADKDVTAIVEMLPAAAQYYCVAANSKRSLPAVDLAAMCSARGLNARAYESVAAGCQAARADSAPSDFIFIGGSNFVVAEAL